jgi:hypothetical protein
MRHDTACACSREASFQTKGGRFVKLSSSCRGRERGLDEKNEQAEVEIRRLCRELDSQSQELVEAERRLEFALSEQEKVCKEVLNVQIQLTVQVEEQNLLRLWLAELEAQHVLHLPEIPPTNVVIYIF